MMWSSLPTLSKENGFEPFKLDSGGTDTQGNDPQNINRYVGQPLRLTRIQGEQPGSPSMGVLYPDLSARELFGTGNKDFVNGVTSSIEGIFLRQQPPSAWDAQARPLETPKQDQDGHRDTHDDFGLRREGRTRDRRTGRYERNPSHSLSPEPNCSQKGASSRQNRDIPGCDSYRYDEWSRGQSRDQDGRRSKGEETEADPHGTGRDPPHARHAPPAHGPTLAGQARVPISLMALVLSGTKARGTFRSF
ncbi:hypothetical protein BU26DRAFT_511272 [Trematosphaeria pertusa]|uniref:Uncharacterized protein n=1 Tax=Trematosphaeria pertusa TaxID=390896 RepID=A0A6A6HV42_9PLEO|nr:uncharacterized protein BU26DRAFT_511272 [Trematosphaeria pertusa]KAF2241897.1 hypothetical protein BU26DRAFT_511272 [Trematosphaeria pertusa]